MGMVKTATNSQILPSSRKAFMSVDECWFWTYVTDAPGSVHDCHIGRVLDDGYIEVLGSLKERCEVCEELEQGKVLVGSTERRRRSEE